MVGKRLGCGKSLGTCCFVDGCNMRAGTNLLSQVKMYCFPKDPERLNAWIAAIKRIDKKPTRNSRICNRHFITGKPSLMRNHSDWTPSLFLSSNSTHQEGNLAHYERAESLQQSISQQESNSHHSSALEANNTTAHCSFDASTNAETDLTMIDFSKGNGEIEVINVGINQKQFNSSFLLDDNNTTGNADCSFDASTETDLSVADMSMKDEEILALKKIVAAFELQSAMLLGSAQRSTFASQVLSSNKTSKFYTGLKLGVFNVLLNSLRPMIASNKINLSHEEQLIVVLSKLRIGLLFDDLATRMEVDIKVVNTAFHSVLDIMFANLKQYVFWPSQKKLRRHIPSCFVEAGMSDVTCVVDCSEVFIETPKNLLARAQTWSQYKHHNTVKFFIGISLAGGVIFVSRCWGGRVADKELTQKEGFLDHLSAGDVVMGDRGFQIRDVLFAKGVVLRVPASTRNLTQLSAEDVILSRRLSSVRVHIERVIGKIKSFRILKQTLPIKFLMSKDKKYATIDKILIVISILCNFQKSVIPD